MKVHCKFIVQLIQVICQIITPEQKAGYSEALHICKLCHLIISKFSFKWKLHAAQVQRIAEGKVSADGKSYFNTVTKMHLVFILWIYKLPSSLNARPCCTEYLLLKMASVFCD